MPITIQHAKERLCLAHVTALAAVARVNAHFLGAQDYGVDGLFRSVVTDAAPGGSRSRESGFGIDFQAKASVSWLRKEDAIVYDLEAKTYNDLVLRSQAASTFIVILLCLPRQTSLWHEVDHGMTVSHAACYWLSLKGEPTSNRTKVRVRFPVQNLLTPASLLRMLAEDQAAKEALFCG